MTSWEQTQTRILREAGELAPLKVLITIIAFPFFVIGIIFGLIWVVATLIWQAVWVGISQSRASLNQKKT